jgi:hypothetical protein
MRYSIRKKPIALGGNGRNRGWRVGREPIRRLGITVQMFFIVGKAVHCFDSDYARQLRHRVRERNVPNEPAQRNAAGRPAVIIDYPCVVFKLSRAREGFDKPKEISSLFGLSGRYEGTAFVYLICRMVRRSAQHHPYTRCGPPIPSERASCRVHRYFPHGRSNRTYLAILIFPLLSSSWISKSAIVGVDFPF